MEKLNRKPKLDIKREITLEDGTTVAIRSIQARAILANVKEKNMSQEERGLRIMSKMLLVKLPDEKEFKEIVYEDLLDCFSVEEMTLISSALTEEDGEKNV